MKQHFCYYCNQETVKDVVLVTFYTKKCNHCRVSYHLDWNDKVTLIVLKSVFKNGTYSVIHDPTCNKVIISKEREKIVWKGNSAEVLPERIIEFDGDYTVINPSNLDKRLKTILTFL